MIFYFKKKHLAPYKYAGISFCQLSETLTFLSHSFFSCYPEELGPVVCMCSVMHWCAIVTSSFDERKSRKIQTQLLNLGSSHDLCIKDSQF